ncbi:MAG TPA: LysR family transcriptional regulator [Candidatus Avipropionibacterium avicola]|uniref:LysR family transcriptional regulator n=2 Tax=Actinomycetes TaxID=1760 RepID=A0A9D1H113_9ACTN|nr:LysR family transcriptional regulator [Candidatus Avipropionibacterium avicola]
MMSADDLRYFLAVAQRGRLVRAAAQLGVDHTTVSRRISALEKGVGQRLFDRTEKGWLLTDAGHMLLSPAETVDSAVALAEERMGIDDGELTGTVRITCPDGFGSFLLAPALQLLNTEHPKLVVEMVTATQHLDEAVRGFDVAVTLEEPTSSRLTHRPLTDYVLRMYATREYLAARPQIETIEDLAAHVVVFYVDHLLNLPSLRLLQRLPVNPVLRSTNVVAQWQACAAGAGIAPLPQYIAAGDPRLVPVLPELVFRRRYWITLSSEHARLARVRAVVDLLNQLVVTRRDDLVGRPHDH